MQPGERIGRYRVDGRIGHGSFATVWRGHDPELDVVVAIKVLADNWAHDLDVRNRFLEEARMLRRLRDQRIIRVHDIGEEETGPYFVMDFADGGTVADRIATGELDRGKALEWGAELARAVQALHDHDIAHRDIKPQNLLLISQPGGPEQLVLADLGTAKALSEASGYTVTAGTPAYMAPEQALGQGFDARADVYSVAAVTYAMLTGRPPFAVDHLVHAGGWRDRPAPEPIGHDHLDAELARALAVDPGQRHGSAGEFADALARVGSGVGPVAGRSVSDRPARSPDRAGGPSVMVVGSTAVLLAVVVALATWWILSAV